MMANHTHRSLGNSFVPMMITRIILSLKKAASVRPKFEMIEILDVSGAIARGPEIAVQPEVMRVSPQGGDALDRS